MKSGLIVLLFVVIAAGASAQSESTRPWISKDVQKVANRKALQRGNVEALHIRAHSVNYPLVAISKGVHRMGTAGEPVASGNIISKGYPKWTISKGVQKIGRQ